MREGNVFTSMCQEFCPRGGACMLYTRPCHTCSPCHTCPLPRHAHPTPDTMRCGPWAGGTHPTGMHSCFITILLCYIFQIFVFRFFIASIFVLKSVTHVSRFVSVGDALGRETTSALVSSYLLRWAFLVQGDLILIYYWGGTYGQLSLLCWYSNSCRCLMH